CPGGSLKITAHALADDKGGTLCVNDATGNVTTADSGVCTASVSCPPHLSVTKGIACAPAGASPNCSAVANYSAKATGVQAGNTCPAFCYKVTITNDGGEDLQSLAVNDSDSVTFNPALPATLARGASFTTYYSQTWCAN